MEGTYRASSIEDFQHALLAVHFDLFPIAVFDGWIVLFNEDALYKLNCECALANTTATENDQFVFTHD